MARRRARRRPERGAALEKEFAAAVGSKHAVACANGTDALVLALRALDIGPGDEVITSPFTFFATAETITLVGATPVFADIEPDTFNLDPKSVEQRITPKTKAILPVHLYGCPANMDALMTVARSHKLTVVEDCAQAFGATAGQRRVGGIGDAGTFSFYPTKVLGCYGDGGMVTVQRDEVAERLRRLRNHGQNGTYLHNEIGYNSRLDEIQAALLRIKLRHIDNDIAGRESVAAAYETHLKASGAMLPRKPSYGRHVYGVYTVRVKNRDQVRKVLGENKVASAIYYPLCLHLQEVYKSLGYQPGSLPVSEQATAEVLSLPIYPRMPVAHIARAAEVLTAALK
jgi:dTDP-4-amino-4,6-dideoxygalactose transaminase